MEKNLTIRFQTYTMGIIFLFIPFFSTSQTTVEAPSKGDGSSGNPYEISSIGNLKWLSETTDKWDKNNYYIQTADIDASDTRNWNSGEGFLSIGNEEVNFTGTYDGGDYTITGLYINNTKEKNITTGLFGTVSNSILKNIHITNAKMSTIINHVGGIFGSADVSQLSNLSVTNSIFSAVNGVGAIGSEINMSNISNCYSSANYLSGVIDVGGLIGRMNEGNKVNNCYSANWIKGEENTGGLIGRSQSSNDQALDPNNKVFNTYSTTIVEGNFNLDGLIGFQFFIETNSYYDKETSGFPNSEKSMGLTTDEFLLSSSFDQTWNINGDLDYDQPWIQNNGSSRPFLYTQKVSVSNGAVVDNKIKSYVSLHNGGKIIVRGYRYAKESDPKTWTEIAVSDADAIGEMEYDLSLSSVMEIDIVYLIVTYAKTENGYVYGDPIKYKKEKFNQTITFDAFKDVKPTATPFTLTGASSSGLEIEYTSSDPSIAMIIKNTVKIIAVGTVDITANQKGNDIYNIAPAVTQRLTVTDAISTGITQLPELEGDIHIYPNPVIDHVNIDLRSLNTVGKYSMTIHSISGHLMYYIRNQVNPQIRIDMGNRPQGIYILNITTDEGIKSQKLIKE